MVSTATCEVCHTPLSPVAVFCPRCGHPVNGSPAPTESPGNPLAPEPAPGWSSLAAPPAETNGLAPASTVSADAVESNGADGLTTLPVRPAGSLTTTRVEPLPPAAEPLGAAMADPGSPAAAGEPGSAPASNEPVPFSPAWRRSEATPPASYPATLPVETAVLPAAGAAGSSLVPAPPLAPPPGPSLASAAPYTPAAGGVPFTSAPAAATPAAPPTGALVLLHGEEVIMQLGALYLTNRRAILYAPTILRAAFLHDIDAIGTVTERSSGWMMLVGMLGVVLAALAAYMGATQPAATLQIGDLYSAPPLLVAIPVGLLGILLLVSYFFWIKRSLFLSVGGRPLIVVSISGWSAKKLESVDSFVNAFSQAKEHDQQPSA